MAGTGTELVDGTSFSWLSNTQIQTTATPALGATVTVIRKTPSGAQLVVYAPGSPPTPTDLNTADLQALYAIQEQADLATATAALASNNAAAVASVLPYQPVVAVANIPSPPLINGQRIEISNSTGIESYSPLTGRPSGFVGASTLTVRLVYTTTGGTWQWVDYRATDPDSRYATFTQTGVGAVGRTVTSKLAEMVSVKDFGAVGDGVVDDTTSIRNCIAANQGKRIYFPPGRYRYAGTNAAGHYLTKGTVAVGAGRDTTVIVATTAGVGSLFYCQGYGSGVESMSFEAEVTQTTGAYVYLGGPESYIQDFFMTGDYRGVIMTGSVSQIRHGRFQDAAPGGIRIDCGGGDNSQTISNVLMGAQTPANIAAAGIRLRNCTALTIHNVSVLQQGTGLLIDPTTVGEPVLNLFASQCFFDNCTNPIKITPSGGAAANRLYFTDVWASSGTTGVYIEGFTGGTVKGVHFTNLQTNLNSGSGVSVGANVSNLSFSGGNVSANSYGFYFNNAINEVNINQVRIGAYNDFSGNTNNAVAFGVAGSTAITITDNSMQGNGGVAIFNYGTLGANCRIVNNKGFNPVGGGVVTVTASPFTYTAGPSPETIYITGGTLSVIETGGLGMFATSEKTIELGPKESLTITYTVAPTVRKVVH